VVDGQVNNQVRGQVSIVNKFVKLSGISRLTMFPKNLSDNSNVDCKILTKMEIKDLIKLEVLKYTNGFICLMEITA